MMIALGREDAAQKNFETSEQFVPSPNNDSQKEAFLELKDGPTDESQETGSKINAELVTSEKTEPSEESWQQRMYHHNYTSWSVNRDSNDVSKCQMNTFQNQIHPFAVNYGFHYPPLNIFSQNQRDSQLQDFQYFIVIDFEATCDKEKIPNPQEIIEFPSVIVSSITGQLEACFQTYVRPTCNQVLSDFCKDLTGIQQTQVDRGVTLNEALLRHDMWLEKKGIKHSNFAVVTWGDWDCRVMLESECHYKMIQKPPYFNQWINLRVPFHEVFGGSKCNLKDAVETAGLSWQGRAHCGLDDAKNTARLLALIMRRGFKFSVTNSLHCQTSKSLYSWTPSQDKTNGVQYQKMWGMRPPHPQDRRYCYCGVTRSNGIIQKPGPRQGSLFFGCGNWTASRGARCHYFEWASPLTH